ncbi:site-specific integrase [Clostridium perfringens]|uniref:site-specific integrase n=1 Tax=Clostridium perfringens TaxID=1502 RepID=UPI0023F6A5A2|nr:site-specific integrase [Clostridium perfringens]WEV20058.1 site-specific integrase [Clostridium perfringens D]
MLNSNFIEDLNVIKMENKTFSSYDKAKYLEHFNYLKSIGTITISCSFWDDYWIFKVGGLDNRFTFLNNIYIKKASKYFSMSSETFELAYRSYVAYYISSRSDISRLNLLLKSVLDYGLSSLNKIGIQYVNPFLEFCEYVKLPQKLAEDLDSCVFNLKRKATASKVIPTFEDIFAFADIINDITYNKNLYNYFEYFPILLWWKITSIIPNRPTEFLSINFNCISEKNGNYYIEIKRSKAKSRFLIKNRYDLEDYYKSQLIPINKSLYDFIFKYQKMVKEICNEKEPKLIIPGEIFLKYGNNKKKPSRELNPNIFTDVDLYSLLQKFYTNVVKCEYGKTPISTFECKNNKENVIQKLTPYDTRHIAIINLILLGNEPQTVMELAGHEKIQTTQGYYNHIEAFSTSYALSYGKRLKLQKKSVLYNINCIPKSNSQNTLNIILNKSEKTKVDGGFCHYPKIKTDKTKCYMVEGIHSICDFFEPNDISTLEATKLTLKDDISVEAKVLRDLVKNHKTISNFSENYSISTSKIDEIIKTLTLLNSK